MKITFLGTGTSQGIPVIGSKHEVCLSDDLKDKRLRSSIMLQWDDATAMLLIADRISDSNYSELKIDQLNGIIFTHYHADHTAGLDDVRPFSQRNGEVQFYCDQAVAENLKERFAYIFATENRYAGAPKVLLNESYNQAFELSGKKVFPSRGLAWKFKIFGYRIDKFAYITDAKSINGKEIEKLKHWMCWW